MGGDSYFVDSFGAALQFANAHPKEARLLWQTKLVYKYSNDGHNLENSHPVFPSRLDVHDLRSVISWSPPFQGLRIFPAVSNDLAASRQSAAEDIDLFNAIELWENFVEDAERRYQFVMKEGDLVLFDNRRVLHARKSFRDMTEVERVEKGVELIPGEPTRWLKGCYLDGDVVWDKLAYARRSRFRPRAKKLGSDTTTTVDEDD
jgi:gamma-butyrobetaine dioxygenase